MLHSEPFFATIDATPTPTGLSGAKEADMIKQSNVGTQGGGNRRGSEEFENMENRMIQVRGLTCDSGSLPLPDLNCTFLLAIVNRSRSEN